MANYTKTTNFAAKDSLASGNAGKVVQTGYEVQINGSPVSIQKIEIQAKNGKLA